MVEELAERIWLGTTCKGYQTDGQQGGRTRRRSWWMAISPTTNGRTGALTSWRGGWMLITNLWHSFPHHHHQPSQVSSLVFVNYHRHHVRCQASFLPGPAPRLLRVGPPGKFTSRSSEALGLLFPPLQLRQCMPLQATRADPMCCSRPRSPSSVPPVALASPSPCCSSSTPGSPSSPSTTSALRPVSSQLMRTRLE
jgi:hypothetical protein